MTRGDFVEPLDFIARRAPRLPFAPRLDLPPLTAVEDGEQCPGLTRGLKDATELSVRLFFLYSPK